MRFDQILEVIVAGLLHEALDPHAPRLRMESAGVLLRIFFVGTELVVVVVRRDLLEGVELVLGRLPLPPRRRHSFVGFPRCAGPLAAVAPRASGGAGQRRAEHAGERKEPSPVDVVLLVGDFG